MEKEILLNTSHVIEKLQKETKEKNPFFTYDFEAITLENVFYPTVVTIANQNLEIVYEDSIVFDNNENASTSLKKKSDHLIHQFLIKCFMLIDNNPRTPKTAIFYAHNASKFDVIFLLKDYALDGVNPDFFLKYLLYRNAIYKLEYSTYLFTIPKFNVLKKIIFYDSKLLMPFSLKVLTKEFSKTFFKKEFDHSNVTLENYKNKEWVDKLKEYCKNDSLSLMDAFSNFRNQIWDLFKIDVLKTITIASLAMKRFRTFHYDPDKTPINSVSFPIYEQIKNAYYGGKVEMFEPILKRGFAYDINGLYAYCMKNFDFPIGEPTIIKQPNLLEELLRKKLIDFFGFVEVTIECPNMKYPFLVYRDKKKFLISPTGTFKGFYFSEEVKHALSLGYKLHKIHEAISFKKSKEVFSSFVDKMQKIKLEEGEKNSPKKIIAKLMLNSLYGKFGSKPENKIKIRVTSEQLKELTKDQESL